MRLAVGAQIGDRGEAGLLRPRAERIDVAAALALPDIVLRREHAIGALEQLAQLGGGIDIAVARGEHAVVLVQRAGRGRRLLRNQIVEAARRDGPGQLLRKATPRRCYAIGRGNDERYVEYRIDLTGRESGNRPPPEALIGQAGVRTGQERSSATNRAFRAADRCKRHERHRLAPVRRQVRSAARRLDGRDVAFRAGFWNRRRHGRAWRRT